ncbi:MAG: hypothetical protein IPM98_19250 [Lewinellaceae bacterium]|nr:hypothetical protein [Lewinellaceae bacterium]
MAIFVWDGRDSSGISAPIGTYIAVARIGSERTAVETREERGVSHVT